MPQLPSSHLVRLCLAPELGLVAAGLGERARLVRLGIGRAAARGLQALRGQLGLVQRIDEDYPGMLGNRLIGPRGEGLAATANGQQHVTGAISRHGYSNPPDRADQALRRATYGVHGHITGFRFICMYWYITARRDARGDLVVI
jgi:hypothetical protein